MRRAKDRGRRRPEWPTIISRRRRPFLMFTRRNFMKDVVDYLGSVISKMFPFFPTNQTRPRNTRNQAGYRNVRAESAGNCYRNSARLNMRGAKYPTRRNCKSGRNRGRWYANSGHRHCVKRYVFNNRVEQFMTRIRFNLCDFCGRGKIIRGHASGRRRNGRNRSISTRTNRLSNNRDSCR